MKLKVINIGNSLGIILPTELLEKLKVKEGDSLYVSKTPNGFELSHLEPENQSWWEEIAGSVSDDPSYDEAMKLGKEYRESFRPDSE